MSDDQHAKDIKDDLPHREGKGSNGSGGACLNRHVAGTPKETVRNSCSHRWQSFLATKSRHDDYDWPKYKSLSQRDRRVPTAQNRHTGFPPWYASSIAVPAEGDWDVKGDNFFGKCTLPYWHEAHHAIPNSVLRAAITAVGKDAASPGEVVKIVRDGLLKEKYNLNHQSNMITLPMDTAVSNSIRLPRHRQTALHRNHVAYNGYVKGKLEPIFNDIKAEIHKNPDYEAAKDQLVSLSEDLIAAIRGAMAGGTGPMGLDQLF